MSAVVTALPENKDITPAYIFDEDELKDRVAKIKEILGDIKLCYSIKANPFLIPALKGCVDHLEVCSPGELAICRHLQVDPKLVIYSGVHKEFEDIREAVEYGVAILTAESIRHYELICHAASEAAKTVDVILRLTSGNQFGMSGEDIRKILENRNENVNIRGIHYFAGTGRKSMKKHREELVMLTEFLADLRRSCDKELPLLEYGPGLGFPYFEDDDRADTLAPLKELMPDLVRVAENADLCIEMGRFLASSCGYYATSICDIKYSSDTGYCIVDGGINHMNYLGQMMGMKVPVYAHYRAGKPVDDSDGRAYCVCGSLCTTNDVLVRSLPLSDPQIGDMIVFEGIGAYSITEAMGLFLSRDLPKVYMYSKGKMTLVRDTLKSWKINTGER